MVDAEQTPREFVPGLEQGVEGSGQIDVCWLSALFGRQEHGAAHEFLREGARGTFGTCSGIRYGCWSQRQIAGVELKQATPGVGIGQWDFDSQIDPAGAIGKGVLQHFDPIRGQHKGDIGVTVETIKGVEHGE